VCYNNYRKKEREKNKMIDFALIVIITVIVGVLCRPPREE
jgi:hypothetical protein